jgi:hypothetical protein
LSIVNSPGLQHHLVQAREWLAASSEGTNTAYLGYAALELRYSIERLAVHYWASLVICTEDKSELLNIGSFKTIEVRIYELAGHQRKIDRSFDFVELLGRLLGIDVPMTRPNISALSRHWHACSEVCHIGWALACVSPEVGPQTFKALEIAYHDVLPMVTGATNLVRLDGTKMHDLQRGYIEGTISDEDVRAFAMAEGLHARYVPPAPGTEPVLVGTPIPRAPPHHS